MTTRVPEAEQEVDLGRYWSFVVARWWLPIVGLVVGAAIGYVIALGASEQFSASATIYLGTPYSLGNVQLSSPQTNPSTVNALIHSEEFIQNAAAAAATTPEAIRDGISSKAISTSTGLTAAQRASANPLVRISVAASTRRRASRAANSLARQVVARLSPLARQKIGYLRRRIEADQTQIETIRRLSVGGGGDTTLKAVLGMQLTNVLQDQLQAQQLLAQAQQVEKPSLLARAVGMKTTARSRRNATVVGGFIGFILGLIAALAWEPIAARTRRP